MRACPAIVGTSLPERDSWALEEFMDTVISADPEARVDVTPYRGVLVAYLTRDPVGVATRFLSYTHAFLARVYPVLLCTPRDRLSELVDRLASIVGKVEVKIEVRLRQPVSRSLSEDEVRRLLISTGMRPGKSGLVVVIESLYDHFVASYGTAHACGPRCRVVLPFSAGPAGDK